MSELALMFFLVYIRFFLLLNGVFLINGPVVHMHVLEYDSSSIMPQATISSATVNDAETNKPACWTFHYACNTSCVLSVVRMLVCPVTNCFYNCRNSSTIQWCLPNDTKLLFWLGLKQPL